MLHISKYQKIYTGNQAAKMSKTKSKKKNYLYTNQQFLPLNKLRLIFPYPRSLQQLKLKSDKIMTLQSWPTPSYFRPWTICLCLRLVSPSKLLVSRWQIPRGSLEWSSRMSAGMISSQARWTKSPAWTSIHSLFTYLPSALQENNRDTNTCTNKTYETAICFHAICVHNYYSNTKSTWSIFKCLVTVSGLNHVSSYRILLIQLYYTIPHLQNV